MYIKMYIIHCMFRTASIFKPNLCGTYEFHRCKHIFEIYTFGITSMSIWRKETRLHQFPLGMVVRVKSGTSSTF